MFLGISTQTWGRIAVVAVLFAAVFWPNLRRLWLKTNPFTGEANWSHSIFVPIIGLYYLFVHREDLIRAGATNFIWGPILRPGRAIAAAVMTAVGAGIYFLSANRTGVIFSMLYPAGAALGALGILVFLLDWSFAAIIFGLAVFVYGIYPGQNDYLKDVGMVITLFGVVLMLNGWNVMRIAWFPIAFLICALPWPPLVYSWVAEPLSQMAAHVAVDVLKLTGVDAWVNGTKIVIFGQPNQPPRMLNVEEACAGMRSLMTFTALAGAWAFLFDRALWQRLIIVASAVPIAIFCNMARISVTGLLDHYVSQKLSDGFAHQFVGMIMLFPAFGLICLVGAALNRIFIEEADDGRSRGSKPKIPTMATAVRPAVVTAAPAAIAAKPVSQPALAHKSVTAIAAPKPAASPRPAAIPTTPRPATMAPTPPRPAPAAVPRPQPAGVPRVAGAGNPAPPAARPAGAAGPAVPARAPAAAPPRTTAPPPSTVLPRPATTATPPRSPVNPQPAKPVDPAAVRRAAPNTVQPAPAPGTVSKPVGASEKEKP
jgi:exosortase